METFQGETIELDIRGQICPSTLLVALREVNRHFAQLNSGNARLVVKSDNRDCTHTIPDAVHNMGLRVEVAKTGEYYTIAILK